MDESQESKIQFHDPKNTDIKSPIGADSVTAELLSEVTSFSRQISTEDTDMSLTEISISDESNPKRGVTRTVSICSPSSVAEEQPKPLCTLLPSSMETCAVYGGSHSFTSISRSQSLQTTKVNTEPDGEDLCAAILLACLFCHPLDCLLATMRACNECVWSLCSSLCGCESTALQPLVDITHHCDLCRCLGVRCFLSDCPICDICLQATECLDLAMEISQMLYH
ncbi:hypothetical protein Q8A73_005264 [Channa argus]|nr:hypothetical protein Q8A73_005264 [Channa argus]